MSENKQEIYQQDMVGDGINSIQKVIEPPKYDSGNAVKYILIGLCTLFLFVMLILPLIVVITNALREGWAVYKDAVLDKYTIKALRLTLMATVTAVAVNTVFGVFASFLLSKFYFRGQQVLAALIDIPFSISPVIAGLIFILTFGNVGWMGDFLKAHHIKIVFAVPGVILATIFVTFPFVFRELFPVLNAQGKDEEEAAAFAVSSILVILAVLILIARSIVEWKTK